MPKRLALLQETVTLTDAQVKALNATPITIVAARSGIYHHFLGGLVVVDAQAGAYTNVSAASLLEIRSGTKPVSSHVDEVASKMTTLLTTTTDKMVAQLAPRIMPWFVLTEGTPNTITVQRSTVHAIEASADVVNKALAVAITNSGGALTGGNAANTMKVTVFYMDLSV